MNILFICSRNQWRSPTAEAVWRKHPDLNVRSAGTSPKARKTVRAPDILWAEVIFVMEQKHKTRLKADFARELHNKIIHCLDIPDDYGFMDPDLVAMVKQDVRHLLNL